MVSKGYHADGLDARKTHQLVLQWHITERCNWRCAHCYQESYTNPELTFHDLLTIKDQYVELLDYVNQSKFHMDVRGHINVSGGEPFIRQDFMDLLEIFKNDARRYSFGILTNGSFIDEAVAKRLKALGPSFVQVSIEGTAETNDKIRGAGATEKTVSAIKNLTRVKIPAVISFTAHRGNFKEFSEVAGLGRRLGVARVWADRLIPEGSGSDLAGLLLTPEETKSFFEIMYAARSDSLKRFCRTEISMHRALQFLVGGGRPYHCAAGNELVTVQPNGDLYPCRRMPINVGNLFNASLLELYTESNIFRALRNQNNTSDDCQGCPYLEKCRGGLKCLSYAVTGNPFTADPGCWLRKPNSEADAKLRFPFDYDMS